MIISRVAEHERCRKTNYKKRRFRIPITTAYTRTASTSKNEVEKNTAHTPNEENNYFHATWRRIVRMPCMSTYFHDLNGSLLLNFDIFLLFFIFIISTKNKKKYTKRQSGSNSNNNYEWNYVLFIARRWLWEMWCSFNVRITSEKERDKKREGQS